MSQGRTGLKFFAREWLELWVDREMGFQGYILLRIEGRVSSHRWPCWVRYKRNCIIRKIWTGML